MSDSAILWTVTRQASLSMGFSRPQYCQELPCPPPRDLPYPGVEHTSLRQLYRQASSFTTSATWEAPTSKACFFPSPSYFITCHSLFLLCLPPLLSSALPLIVTSKTVPILQGPTHLVKFPAIYNRDESVSRYKLVSYSSCILYPHSPYLVSMW